MPSSRIAKFISRAGTLSVNTRAGSFASSLRTQNLSLTVQASRTYSVSGTSDRASREERNVSESSDSRKMESDESNVQKTKLESLFGLDLNEVKANAEPESSQKREESAPQPLLTNTSTVEKKADPSQEEDERAREIRRKREEVLSQLRQETLLTPTQKLEDDILKKKLNFEDKHVKAMSVFDEKIDVSSNISRDGTSYTPSPDPSNESNGSNTAQSTGEAADAAEDPYAYVRDLEPARYVATKEGSHFWQTTFVFTDENGEYKRYINLSLKDSTLLKEKFQVEDLNLAVNMFMNGEPTHPQGVQPSSSDERRLKKDFSDQVFEYVATSRWERGKLAVLDLFKFKNAMPIILRSLIFYIIIGSIVMAFRNAKESYRMKKEQAKEDDLEKARRNEEARERARQLRIAQGKPIYDETTPQSNSASSQ